MKKIFYSCFLLSFLFFLFTACGKPPVSVEYDEPYQSGETSTIKASDNGFLYQAFNEESLKSMENVSAYALFFHASWCPTCRGIENGILKEIENFPPDTIIFKVDYDTEEALKKQYGITVQATVVVLDSHKNVVQKLVAPKVQDVIDGLASLSVEEPS